MRRIYIISVIRQVFHPVVFKSIILLGFLVVANLLVSIPSVINNMLVASDTKIDFILKAFLQTETLVQLVSLGSIFLIIWLIMDAVKGLSLFNHNNRPFVS